MQWLNNLISMVIAESKHKTKVSLIYSSNEVSYEREVKELIEFMKYQKIDLDLYDEEYEEHSDIGKYFVPYLRHINQAGYLELL